MVVSQPRFQHQSFGILKVKKDVKRDTKLPRTLWVRNTSVGDEEMTKHLKKFGWWSALLALAFATVALPIRAAAQDDQGPLVKRTGSRPFPIVP